jgi:hypothetical protein
MKNVPLFQIRYKSILCEEDPCLKELVRYIPRTAMGGHFWLSGSCFNAVIRQQIQIQLLREALRGFEKLGSAERDGYEIVNFDLTSLAI